MSSTEIKKALSILYDPGEVFEVRMLPKGKSSVYSGYFNDIDKCAEICFKMDGIPEGIYTTINPCKPELLARAFNRVEPQKNSRGNSTTEPDILKRKWLMFDIDAVRPAGISASELEHELAIKTAIELSHNLKKDMGFPDAVVGDSGNGAHVEYRIDLPNSKEIKELLESVFKVIREKYNKVPGIDLQTFADANRIWKLKGSMVCKGDNLPERPHRRSKLLETPDNREIVTIELLQKISDMLDITDKTQQPEKNTATPKNKGKAWTPDKLESWLKEHGAVIERTKNEQNMTRFVLQTCLYNSEHDGHKEAEVHINATGMIGYKCHHNSCKDVTWKMVRAKNEEDYKEKQDFFSPCQKESSYKENQGLPTLAKVDDSYHWTDLGNAQRLKDTYGDRFRYCHPMNNWLVWDNTRWNLDQEAWIEQVGARGVLKQLFEEANNIEDNDKRRDKLSLALKMQNAGRIAGMITLAKSEPGIPILPEILDKDKMLFNVQNGTIDLRTGKLRPHSKDDYITKISPVIYDDKATCPTWTAFLNKIFDNKKDVIEYLQRKAGYILTGETIEEEIDELYGTGSNGKSKFVEQIMYILGEYAVKSNVETIQAASDRTSGSSASSDVARLKGARLVTVSEPAKGTQLNEQRIKDWTGRDHITARHLYQEPITFLPEFKLWIYTNYELRIRGTDNGIWRRVKLVPFNVTIPDAEQDKKLDKKLLSESPGILNWMIKGCLMWQKEGLKVPTEIIEATETYREEQDYLGEFFKVCCELNKDKKCQFSCVFLVYRAYCKIMDMKAQGRIGFIDTLKSKNFKKVHSEQGNFYTGFSLNCSILTEYESMISTCSYGDADALTHMTQFLETFLAFASCREFTETASGASGASGKEEPDNDNTIISSCNGIVVNNFDEFIHTSSEIFIKQNGVINSTNIIKMSMWFCDQYNPTWKQAGKVYRYEPSMIKKICHKVFQITPAPAQEA